MNCQNYPSKNENSAAGGIWQSVTFGPAQAQLICGIELIADGSLYQEQSKAMIFPLLKSQNNLLCKRLNQIGAVTMLDYVSLI